MTVRRTRISLLAPRTLVAIAVSTLALLWPAAGHAAQRSLSVEVNGAEIWATQTVGTFVGEAHGDATGPWQASVEHTPLTTSADVTGGDYRMSLYVDGDLTTVTGEFDDGKVEQIDPASANGCRNQYFAVTASGPAAELDVTLVHYRQSIFGQCFIYSASVSGEIALMLDDPGAGELSGGGGLFDSIGSFFAKIGGVFS